MEFCYSVTKEEKTRQLACLTLRTSALLHIYLDNSEVSCKKNFKPVFVLVMSKRGKWQELHFS